MSFSRISFSVVGRVPVPRWSAPKLTPALMPTLNFSHRLDTRELCCSMNHSNSSPALAGALISQSISSVSYVLYGRTVVSLRYAIAPSQVTSIDPFMDIDTLRIRPRKRIFCVSCSVSSISRSVFMTDSRLNARQSGCVGCTVKERVGDCPDSSTSLPAEICTPSSRGS